MSAVINIQFRPGKIQEMKIGKWSKGKARRLFRAFEFIGPIVTRQAQRNITKQVSTRRRAGANRRTGHLARETRWANRMVGNMPQLKIGNAAVYARIREFGGTIRAKRVRFLTIPFPNITGKAREYQNTFFQRTPSGALILFQKMTEGIRPLFLLKREVKHPKQPWLFPALRQKRRVVIQLIRAGLNRPLR